MHPKVQSELLTCISLFTVVRLLHDSLTKVSTYSSLVLYTRSAVLH